MLLCNASLFLTQGGRITSYNVCYTKLLRALLITVVLVVKNLVNEPFAYFTREPAYTAGLTPLAGLLSNIGILIWAATVPFCILAAAISPEKRMFFWISGLLTFVLVIDDMAERYAQADVVVCRAA